MRDGRGFGKHCSAGPDQQETSGLIGFSFQCPTNCPAGVKGPQGLQGVKVKGWLFPGMRVAQVLRGEPGAEESLLPPRGIQANGGFWVILVARGSQ